MHVKLRTIRTTRRAASVKRCDVAAAVKAVIALRDAETGHVAEPRSVSRSQRKRAQKVMAGMGRR